MDLKRKLSRLVTPGRKLGDAPPREAPAEASAEAPMVLAMETQDAPVGVRGELQHRLRRKAARRASTVAVPGPSPTLLPLEDPPRPWPFTAQSTPAGEVHTAGRTYGPEAVHGVAPLARALEVTGEAVATLALDPTLAGFDPTRALYLDTETTGLAGGAGTLPFLVGAGWFEGGAFVLEQYLLADLGVEQPMMAALAARIERSQCLVTFNGKSFDLPLLRSRFVMARVAPPAERPHLDLLHVARRIYGERVTRCTLTSLERDVLGFTRLDDIPGAEIPERYLRYLREGATAALVPVVEHNAWDVVALAALVGELGARAARAEASGRWEPRDLLGLARTTLRAGHAVRAVSLATEAAARTGDPMVARDAHVLAADGHRHARDPEATARRLLDALAHAPDDPGVHLALARCFERELSAPDRALCHALRAAAAEDPGAHARRLTRLRRAVARGAHLQLKLPGF